MFEGLLQPTHLIVLLVLALVILGPKRLPEVGRALGSGMRGFRDSISDHDDDVSHAAPPVEARVAEAHAAPPRSAAPPASDAPPVVRD